MLNKRLKGFAYQFILLDQATGVLRGKSDTAHAQPVAPLGSRRPPRLGLVVWSYPSDRCSAGRAGLRPAGLGLDGSGRLGSGRHALFVSPHYSTYGEPVENIIRSSAFARSVQDQHPDPCPGYAPCANPSKTLIKSELV